jgi:hypothetical protein
VERSVSGVASRVVPLDPDLAAGIVDRDVAGGLHCLVRRAEGRGVDAVRHAKSARCVGCGCTTNDRAPIITPSAQPLIPTRNLARVEAGDEGAATGVLLTATQVANALGIAILTGIWTTATRTVTPRDALAYGFGAAIVMLGIVAIAAAGLRRDQSTTLIVDASSPVTD